MLLLQGKSVLITGAASGIGKACAIAFAESGAHVIAVDLDLGLLKNLESNYSVEIIEADLTKPEQYFPDNLEIDILINNAGIQHVSPLEEFSMEKADVMLSLMLRTPFTLFKSRFPQCIQGSGGA